MYKLKKCPFCGGEAELIKRKSNFPYIHGVWCIGCKCRTSFEKSEEIAIEKWNNRKPDDDVLERLEKELNSADAEKKRCAGENPFHFDIAKGCAQGLYNAIKIIKDIIRGI